MLRDEVVPRSLRAVKAVRGAWAGNRSGYLDLLDTVRRALDSRLKKVDAAREAARHRAGLLRAVGVRWEMR